MTHTEKYKVSIIIPTCDRDDFLFKSLQSVENAISSYGFSSKEIEIIVIDDAHSAITERKIDELSSELQSVIIYQQTVNGPRSGPSAARNQGISAAHSCILYLLDDDDQFLPNRFVKSFSLLSSGDYDVVLERSLRVYEDNSGRESFITGPERFDQEPFYYLLTGGPDSHITPGATAFTKDVFNRCGGYDNKLRYGEDVELLLRLCLYGRVALVGGDSVCKYSFHANNSSGPLFRDYWQTMASLSCLYHKVRAGKWDAEKEFLEAYIAAKLDYELTCLRVEDPSYFSRIFRGLKCLRYFPKRCLTYANCKSMLVWLTKSQPREV